MVVLRIKVKKDIEVNTFFGLIAQGKKFLAVHFFDTLGMESGLASLNIEQWPSRRPDAAEQAFTQHNIVREYEIAKFGAGHVGIGPSDAAFVAIGDKLLAAKSTGVDFEQDVGLLAFGSKHVLAVDRSRSSD